jgi:hypothetical protein
MGNVFEVEQVNAVEAVESAVFEIRLLLRDGSETTLRLNGPTLWPSRYGLAICYPLAHLG